MSRARQLPFRRRAGTLLAAGAVLAAAGCGSEVGSAPAPGAAAPVTGDDLAGLPPALTEQDLSWSGCGAAEETQGEDAGTPPPAEEDSPWECADLTVPLDWEDPEGETLDLALIRSRVTGPEAERLGSLIFNFGGPGGSGVVTLPAFGPEYATLHERYDLVSFDPRGVGGSSGVVCLDDAELDEWFAAPISPADPDDEGEVTAYTDRLASFADACEKRQGELLPHLTTTATARDLNLLRHVLGDAELYYFGVSYGTELGAVTAHLYPERMGRVVLDAVVDPTMTDAESALGQARGFQLALGNFLADCAGEDDCPLGGDPAEGERILADLLEGLREEPMPTADPDRPLTQSLAWSGLAQSLYSRDFWPFLTQGLDEALDEEEPDGTILRVLGDAMNGRSSDGSYSTLQSSFLAINCADSSERYTVEDVRERLPEFREASPIFGEGMAWGMLACSEWPVEGEAELPTVNAEGAAPMLLIGTTGDPATPYEGTAAMKEALGEGVAVELTREGEGHGAYTGGSRCVTRAVDRYLLDGELPEDGLVCSD
ncbi:alpha/beta hydrolase [Streptomyces sp. ST2-7A]|uniref:alpha/beta hydrolase n=1 Tax=Streptomyces sp. ST2-7A TaxID=2907214 RepID=UPI001F3400DE|nr:alpha/beta hydrolase [Streptomyces sp. ST2-7A]MCE7082495.1 alpha/beta hydrolase [Streptomyces sp. ST2-7A]